MNNCALNRKLQTQFTSQLSGPRVSLLPYGHFMSNSVKPSSCDLLLDDWSSFVIIHTVELVILNLARSKTRWEYYELSVEIDGNCGYRNALTMGAYKLIRFLRPKYYSSIGISKIKPYY